MKFLLFHLRTNHWITPLLAAALSATAAIAQPFPHKPITLVVPYAPGGAGDILGRALQVELAALLGQPVVVENKPGAGGNLGAEVVGRSARADGYTLLFTGASLASNPALMRKMPFEPLKTLRPIAGPISLQHIVVVNPQMPVRSVRDLIIHAKSKPNHVFFGSSGQGTSNHLAVELFKVKAGVEMTHVPFKSSGAAMPNLLSGEIQVMFDLLPSSIQQVNDGRLRALAVTGARRLPILPDLPTVSESGLPGYEYAGWFGLFAPAATPRDVVARINSAANAAIASPAFQARLAKFGAEAYRSTPESFSHFFRSETSRWAKVVKEGGVPPLD